MLFSKNCKSYTAHKKCVSKVTVLGAYLNGGAWSADSHSLWYYQGISYVQAMKWHWENLSLSKIPPIQLTSNQGTSLSLEHF